tara:strand:+ start:222 stop:380 length:159 start_codon:yes stop_codon:yes gene_type:complete
MYKRSYLLKKEEEEEEEQESESNCLLTTVEKYNKRVSVKLLFAIYLGAVELG